MNSTIGMEHMNTNDTGLVTQDHNFTMNNQYGILDS
jgi:hypothetical protein